MPFKILHEQFMDLGLSKYQRRGKFSDQLDELGASNQSDLSLHLLTTSTERQEVTFAVLGQVGYVPG